MSLPKRSYRQTVDSIRRRTWRCWPKKKSMLMWRTIDSGSAIPDSLTTKNIRMKRGKTGPKVNLSYLELRISPLTQTWDTVSALRASVYTAAEPMRKLIVLKELKRLAHHVHFEQNVSGNLKKQLFARWLILQDGREQVLPLRI